MIYKSNKLLKEEYLDSVQDPDNTGVDLKQVEDDIAGDDGIEAHIDEIQDAIDGTISENTIIKRCGCFVNEKMYYDCIGNNELIKRQAILEGAKLSEWFNKFFKTGKDYEGLRKELREIVYINNLPKDELKTFNNISVYAKTSRKVVNKAFKLLEILGGIMAAGTVVGARAADRDFDISKLESKKNFIKGMDKNSLDFFGINPDDIGKKIESKRLFVTKSILFAIIAFVISFVITKLCKYYYEYNAFDEVEQDCKVIMQDLEIKAKSFDKTGDKESAEHCRKEAKRMKEAIEKYKHMPKKNIKESSIFEDIKLV